VTAGSRSARHRWRSPFCLIAAAALQLCAGRKLAAAATLAGDTNCDGVVQEGADVPALLIAVFNHSSCSTADVNMDGRIAVADLSAEILILRPTLPTSTPNRTATEATTRTPPLIVSSTPTRTLTAGPMRSMTPLPTSSTPGATVSPAQPSPTGATQTPTPAATGIGTASPTPSRTATGTVTATGSATGTSTVTCTPTETRPTGTPTVSGTPTRTPTMMPSPTRSATPTMTVGLGPRVLVLAIVKNFDGCVFCCSPSCRSTPTPTPQHDTAGRQIVEVQSGQFVIVVEGAPGLSGAAVGSVLQPNGGGGRPDLQVQSTQPAGNGSPEVCDTGAASAGGGGIPGIAPPSFDPADTRLTDALNDMACRFQVFAPSAPCTLLDASGEARPINPAASVQFCDFVAATAAYPPGDSIFTVQLRDVVGNLGPPAQIVVRVVPSAPSAGG